MSPFDGLAACAARRAAADAMADEATDGDHWAHVGTENSQTVSGQPPTPRRHGHNRRNRPSAGESNANAAVAAFAAMVARFNSHTGPFIMPHLHCSTGLSESRRWTCRLFTACTTLVASSRTSELLRTQQRITRRRARLASRDREVALANWAYESCHVQKHQDAIQLRAARDGSGDSRRIAPAREKDLWIHQPVQG